MSFMQIVHMIVHAWVATIYERVLTTPYNSKCISMQYMIHTPHNLKTPTYIYAPVTCRLFEQWTRGNDFLLPPDVQE